MRKMASCSSTGKINIGDNFSHEVILEAIFNFSSNVIGIIYRDKTEELKQLTPTERQEIKNQDARNVYGASSAYSVKKRRERALKIYVDSSPKKRDD